LAPGSRIFSVVSLSAGSLGLALLPKSHNDMGRLYVCADIFRELPIFRNSRSLLSENKPSIADRVFVAFEIARHFAVLASGLSISVHCLRFTYPFGEKCFEIQAATNEKDEIISGFARENIHSFAHAKAPLRQTI
jgi:hypothetical protein